MYTKQIITAISAISLAAARPDLTSLLEKRDYGSCSGGVSGTCQKTSVHCANPYSSAPLCPGDETIRCCPSSAPKTYGSCSGGVDGICQKTSQPCANAYSSAPLCPGDESIRCCPTSKSSSGGGKTPPPDPPVVHHDPPGLVDPPGECVSPVRDTCDFYPNCLETKYHCGSSGYPIGYGLKYCNAFTDAKSRFDDKGDKWVSDTMLCLQNALVSSALAQPPLMSCGDLKEKAIGTHPDCYVNSGVCTLGPKDWEIIVTTVDLKDLFGSVDNLKAALKTVEDCVEFYEWLIEQGILIIVDEVEDKAKDVWHKITSWF